MRISTLNICVIILTTTFTNGYSQIDIPVDTSFNGHSELQKHIGHFPFIQLAETGDSSSLVIHRDVEYVRHKDRTLHLDVIYPDKDEANTPFPVIILIHGGGWRSGNKTMEHPMAFELARRGYATICVEYRLSMEAIYPAAVEDIITAVRWVKANFNYYPIDTARVVLYGTSSGGQLASLVGSINAAHRVFKAPYYEQYRAKVQAVVNIDGVLAFIHPESGEGQDRPGRPSAATLWFGSTTSERPDLRVQASALTHVDQQSAPMLFINSSIPRFGAGRDDMMKALHGYNISTRAHQHEESMHTFWLFHPWFELTVNWIDEFLGELLSYDY